MSTRSLLGEDSETLAQLLEWLDGVQTPLPGDRSFLEEMAWRVDPEGCDLMEDSAGFLPGESTGSRPLRTFSGRWRRR